jgi:hypothetical protein
VLLERSKRSTDPWSSVELELEPVLDAVGLLEVPVEPLIVGDVSVPVLLVLLLVDDGRLVSELDDVLPIEPLLVSSVFVVVVVVLL